MLALFEKLTAYFKKLVADAQSETKNLATAREIFDDEYLVKELDYAFPPPLTLTIERVDECTETWFRETRMLAVFPPELFQWSNEEGPSSIREASTPFWRAIGFSKSIDALLNPKTDALNYQRLSHVKISRIEGMRHWKPSSATLEETEQHQNDRFPDHDTDINLRLDLTGPSFDYLAAMINTHTPPVNGTYLWLCIGLACSEFALPIPRKMDKGRAPPDTFTRDLKVDRILFELGISRGSDYIPDHIQSIARWMTIEGAEIVEPPTG